MENCLLPTKRKMDYEITEDFESSYVMKKNKGNNVKSLRFKIIEVKGDLFSSQECTSLAHCVSLDFKLGKGIANLFKNKFGGLQELQKQNCHIGDVGVLKRGGRFIYYLITKERHWHKPTYLHLRTSLTSLKAHASLNNVSYLAMPRIGCGLDGLVWEKVREIITDIFKDTDIIITVYSN